jgi:hypothetical protein
MILLLLRNKVFATETLKHRNDVLNPDGAQHETPNPKHITLPV